MPDNIDFSILVPSVTSRADKQLPALIKHIMTQVGEKNNIEVLSIMDNKKRTIGEKRDDHVRLAQGRYLAFVDDDDWISSDYVKSILNTIQKPGDPDLIVFNQKCIINNENAFIVRFGVEYENEHPHKKDGMWQDIKRKPFHVCVWKSFYAKKVHFPHVMYGEDWKWASSVLQMITIQARINKVLHSYRYDKEKTEAE